MTLAELERRNPEWRTWLARVEALIAELDNPEWDAAVPPLPRTDSATPLAEAAQLDPARAPIPLLHACRRRWREALPKAWDHGHCPLCGSWPAFAEVCGVERARYLRCVRCGTAWRAHGLACPFCGTRDHAQLGALALEGDGARRSIEVCRACKGYLKVFSALAPAAPERVLLEDAASVELDIAAAMRGYRRP